jgi:hypothetical protein
MELDQPRRQLPSSSDAADPAAPAGPLVSGDARAPVALPGPAAGSGVNPVLAPVPSAPPPAQHHGFFDWASSAYDSARDAVSSGAHAVADTATSAYHGAVDLGTRAVNTVEQGVNAAEGAVASGVHSAEHFVDAGSHALAARVADVPVLGTVARGGADLVSGAARLEGNLLEGAAHAVAHPLDTARGVVNTVERGANAVSHGVDVAEGAVRTGMHHAEDWVDHGTHALADRVSNVPVLGALAHSAADGITADAQFVGGVAEGATDFVGGLVNTVAHPINTAKGLEALGEHAGIPILSSTLRAGHDLIDGRSLGETADRALNPFNESTRREDGQFWHQAWNGIKEPYARSVNEGRPMEALGHGAFDLASMLVGVGEAGDAARIAEVGSTAERASTIARVGSVASDTERLTNVARAGEVASDVERTSSVARAVDVSGEVRPVQETGEVAAPLTRDADAAEQVSAVRSEAQHTPPVEAHVETPPAEAPPSVNPPERAPPDMPPPDSVPPEGAAPEPRGPRSETREEYKARRSRERATETVRNADRPLEPNNPNKAQVGHGHARHGFETTEEQQAERVRSGRYPDDPPGAPPGGAPVGRSSRFSSPEAEAEALGRGRRQLDADLANGNVPTFPDPATGQPTFVNPATGEPVRRPVKVTTNREGGFGTSQVVRRQPPPVDSFHLDPNGNRVAVPSPTPMPAANVVWEYVPSTGEWRTVTQHPSPAPLPNGTPPLR